MDHCSAGNNNITVKEGGGGEEGTIPTNIAEKEGDDKTSTTFFPPLKDARTDLATKVGHRDSPKVGLTYL